VAGSLFDRMTLGEAGVKMDEDESIRLHIERMFTSRQGSVPTLPDDYGLPDLNDLTLSRYELSQKNCLVMTACINKYEKRLMNAEVSERSTQEKPFIQQFVITAQKYDTDGRLIPWKWEMTLENGNIRKRS
jgi:type VI secretion system protein